MHEAEKRREVLLLVRKIEDSVASVWGPVWPPPRFPHTPPKNMNIYKSIMIMAGGAEKMRDGVQGPAGASPDEILPPPILWGGFSCDQVGLQKLTAHPCFYQSYTWGGGSYVLTCVTHSHATQLMK